MNDAVKSVIGGGKGVEEEEDEEGDEHEDDSWLWFLVCLWRSGGTYEGHVTIEFWTDTDARWKAKRSCCPVFIVAARESCQNIFFNIPTKCRFQLVMFHLLNETHELFQMCVFTWKAPPDIKGDVGHLRAAAKHRTVLSRGEKEKMTWNQIGKQVTEEPETGVGNKKKNQKNNWGFSCFFLCEPPTAIQP